MIDDSLPPLPEALRDFVVTGNELISESSKPTDFAVDRLVEREDLVLMSGREKLALKTMLALDLGIARIVGGAWLGFDVARGRGRVLYLSSETGVRQMGRRLRALCAGRTASFEEVASRFACVGEPITMIPRATREQRAAEASFDSQLAATRVVDERRRHSLIDASEEIGARKARLLGRHLDKLTAIEDAPKGSWCLIVVDTLRASLKGKENDSDDVHDFMQATRELARSAGCPCVVLHHNSKGAAAGDSRSARGSVEVTAAPDVIITLDATPESATASFTLRNHEAPLPLGYGLAVDGPRLRIELREVEATSAKSDVSVDDVRSVFAQGEPLTTSRVRALVSEARGGKPGSKAPQQSVERHLRALQKNGAVSPCEIRAGSKTFPGWVLGSEGGVVRASGPVPRRRTVEADAAREQ